MVRTSSSSPSPILVADPRGNKTLISRDEAGQIVARIRGWNTPSASTTQIEYDDFGQIVRDVDPNGTVTEYEYYVAPPRTGYLEKVTVDPGGLGLVTQYETDELGNVTAVTDPRGVRHEYEYNELSWLVTQRLGASSASGIAEATDEVVYVYDAIGNVVEERRGFGDGTVSTAIQRSYGNLGELLEIRRGPAGRRGMGDGDVYLRSQPESSLESRTGWPDDELRVQ